MRFGADGAAARRLRCDVIDHDECNDEYHSEDDQSDTHGGAQTESELWI